MRRAAMLLMMTILAGCAGRAELWPNDDPRLQKTSAEFAADAARRFPYPANAPHGGQAMASAEANYFTHRIYITNLSDTDWTDVEMWINGSYVIFLPGMESKRIEKPPFQAIFNEKGQSYPTYTGSWYSPSPVMVTKVELYRDGKLYDVPVRASE